jgi:hypothetical protein
MRATPCIRGRAFVRYLYSMWCYSWFSECSDSTRACRVATLTPEEVGEPRYSGKAS